MSKKTSLNKAAASRIQSATAVKNGGSVPKGSWASKAQSTVAKKSN